MASGSSSATGVGVGVSRLKNEIDFSSAILEGVFEPLEGSVFNWETIVSTLRGNFGILYDREHGQYCLKGSAHFSYSQIDSFDESRQFSGSSEHASTLTIKMDVRYPLGFEIRKHSVYIIGHIGNTNFVGSNRDDLWFYSFDVKKVTLGALAIFGDEVSGWNLILNYGY